MLLQPLPDSIDWRIPPSGVGAHPSVFVYVDNRKRLIRDLPFIANDTRRVMIFSHNHRDIGNILESEAFRKSPAALAIREVEHLTSEIWRCLFQPAIHLARHIERAMRATFGTDNPSSFIAVHFRSGDGQLDKWWDPKRHGLDTLDEFLACAARVEEELGLSAAHTKWLLSSDTEDVFDTVAVREHGAKIVRLRIDETNEGEEIVHIDRSSDVYHQFTGVTLSYVNYYILQKAAAIVLSRSFFGETAAEIGRIRHVYFYHGCVRKRLMLSSAALRFFFPELPVDTFCVEAKVDDDSAWTARFAYSLRGHPTVPQETPVLPMLQGEYETHEGDIINYIRPVLHKLNVVEKNAVREWFTELGKAFDVKERLDPRDVLVHVGYHDGKLVLDKEVTVELSPPGYKPSAPKYASRENGWGSVVKRKRVESDFEEPYRKKRFRRPADPVAITSGNYEYIDPTQETPNVWVQTINNTKGMVGAEVKFGLCEDDRGKELASTGFVNLTGSYRAFRLDTNSMPEENFSLEWQRLVVPSKVEVTTLRAVMLTVKEAKRRDIGRTKRANNRHCLLGNKLRSRCRREWLIGISSGNDPRVHDRFHRNSRTDSSWIDDFTGRQSELGNYPLPHLVRLTEATPA
ncbi:hypothetical protein FOZ63_006765 [Perkinsus olseni]|uniref:Uncharacterized protein n=1 Tax=Perkinsus olseni TaxID=32597 RepID=A0A7J6T2D1_PEROL|nr:hypothetical protein FOZ63_006765 [Perkinsus olseni]KAF4739225.1 hypothetical protein FOZ62_022859 [Perkinsus olseni]